MNWIQHPLSLEGQRVKLVPLERHHFDELHQIAGNKKIWLNSVIDIKDGSDREKMEKSLNRELEKRASGEFYPFVVLLKENNKLVGHTMYWALNPEHRSLEVGSTWYHPDYWGSGINTEAKYLMLTYCFEVLKTIRVQIKASNTNERSRGAIEKVGFTFEGILRKDKILEDGSHRTAAYYSIIDEEWVGVKAHLEKLLDIR